MTTRNRTAAFQRLREARRGSGSEKLGRGSSSSGLELQEVGSGQAVDAGPLLGRAGADEEANGGARLTAAPVWMTAADEVQYNLHQLGSKMAELAGRHSKHLLPGAFDDEDRARRDIELLTDHITRQFRNTKALVQEIAKRPVATPQEQQIKRNLQAALAAQLHELSTSFRRSQRDYLARLEGRAAKRTTLLDNYQQPAAPAAAAAAGQDQSFTVAQLDAAGAQRALLAERDREVRQIARSIGELVEVFRDLNTLVVEQGTLLDRIDHNIAAVESNTRAAVTELQAGARELRNARQKYCMLVLCVALLGCGLILAFKLVFRMV